MLGRFLSEKNLFFNLPTQNRAYVIPANLPLLFDTVLTNNFNKFVFAVYLKQQPLTKINQSLSVSVSLKIPHYVYDNYS